MFPTEFEFTLPKGYLDTEGTLHRAGTMRLAKAIDEITPLKDPRVQANPAYATVIILARVVTQLGMLDDINPDIIENLYASDLNYLYNLYRQVNDLESEGLMSNGGDMSSTSVLKDTHSPTDVNRVPTTIGQEG